MYHGSNTMYRKYTVKKGKIDEINLVPGMAVFKRRDWTSAQSSNGWYETSPGDMYHVGLYIGNGLVVEAQGKKTGVVITKINTWHYAAELIDTIYDATEQNDKAAYTLFLGIVSINSGWLNLRSAPSTAASRVDKAYNGDMLNVIGESGDWYAVEKNGKTMYANKSYVKVPVSSPSEYVFTIRVSAACKQQLVDILDGYVYNVEESWDAA